MVAKEFQPPQLFGYAKTGVKTYAYNPSKAKSLLKLVELPMSRATSTSGTRRRCRGRTCLTRKRNFEVFQASLEASGLQRSTPHTAKWRPDYVSKVNGRVCRGSEPDRLDG